MIESALRKVLRLSGRPDLALRLAWGPAQWDASAAARAAGARAAIKEGHDATAAARATLPAGGTPPGTYPSSATLNIHDDTLDRASGYLDKADLSHVNPASDPFPASTNEADLARMDAASTMQKAGGYLSSTAGDYKGDISSRMRDAGEGLTRTAISMHPILGKPSGESYNDYMEGHGL